MENIVEKFYELLFSDNDINVDVPYKHKLTVFTITLIIFLIVLFFITRFIINNMQQITYEGLN